MGSILKKGLISLVFALVLAACGDLTVNGSVAADGAIFDRSFRYYYVMDCRFDGIGLYDCGYEEVVSPAYTASLRIDSDGFASLNLDGRYSYYYTEREYDSGSDEYGRYYYFYENDWELTLYRDGSELVIWDTYANTATVYLRDLDY